MTAFDRAWGIVKENDDYSKFGEKFAERMKEIKEGGRGLPEGTKLSDLRPTTSEKPEMPEGEPINILDLHNYRSDPVEIENNRIVDAMMGRGMSYPKSLIDRVQRNPTPKKDD
jgi:hypothetical protein|tara:strand:- start:574 stop:912 length:339 start_codon:yes stop_codon:yes gene_type:complete